MTKRPRNAAQTRADILASARRRFEVDGVDRTPLRAIAADVGVDAAMVTRYFGSKQDLFATATEFTIELPDLTDADPDDIADMLLPRYFAVWEEDHSFMALLQAAMTSRVPPDKLNEPLAIHAAPTLKAATPDYDLQRIALTDAFVIGLAATRSVLGNVPAADLTREELRLWAAPVVRPLLGGPAAPLPGS